MHTFTANQARADLPKLIDEVVKSHEPIEITGSTNSAILVAQEDWSAIQETLHLLSIQGMRDSICEGLVTPLAECGTELDW
ncbi:MAG: type II toxin-antitoxin system prevent-host-death family antitoxin [Candidatus Methylumidiphilus alinenensis]|uniref:Antitoxin n=1 Tax=Candidatus Methylumidiphilus alinenensis TaxID=2202197 RepID=A0A2W4R658_9GAMM|nr:MAG: type II toxin-antitoxin system prevent-host-death family antitoxin [Candidatus Methylumidiphilus alinenensis]